MFSLVIISKINAYRASSLLSDQEFYQELVTVTVSGAVVKPGDYQVPAGTTVREVLKKARPKPNANVQAFTLGALIDSSIHLNVAALTEISVRVQGEVVAPQKLTLPAESRISDLKEKVLLTQNADKSYFRRRKRLKNGEIIVVPKKTVE